MDLNQVNRNYVETPLSNYCNANITSFEEFCTEVENRCASREMEEVFHLKSSYPEFWLMLDKDSLKDILIVMFDSYIKESPSKATQGAKKSLFYLITKHPNWSLACAESSLLALLHTQEITVSFEETLSMIAALYQAEAPEKLSTGSLVSALTVILKLQNQEKQFDLVQGLSEFPFWEKIPPFSLKKLLYLAFRKGEMELGKTFFVSHPRWIELSSKDLLEISHALQDNEEALKILSSHPNWDPSCEKEPISQEYAPNDLVEEIKNSNLEAILDYLNSGGALQDYATTYSGSRSIAFYCFNYLDEEKLIKLLQTLPDKTVLPFDTFAGYPDSDSNMEKLKALLPELNRLDVSFEWPFSQSLENGNIDWIYFFLTQPNLNIYCSELNVKKY